MKSYWITVLLEGDVRGASWVDARAGRARAARAGMTRVSTCNTCGTCGQCAARRGAGSRRAMEPRQYARRSSSSDICKFNTVLSTYSDIRTHQRIIELLREAARYSIFNQNHIIVFRFNRIAESIMEPGWSPAVTCV